MDLKHVMLREGSQTQDYVWYNPIYMKLLEKEKHRDRTARSPGAGSRADYTDRREPRAVVLCKFTTHLTSAPQDGESNEMGIILQRLHKNNGD